MTKKKSVTSSWVSGTKPQSEVLLEKFKQLGVVNIDLMIEKISLDNKPTLYQISVTYDRKFAYQVGMTIKQL